MSRPTVPKPLVAALFGMTLTALAGCAVGPDYKAPEEKLVAFHNAERATSQKSAPALDQWWTGFNDPMLSTMVDRALAQNLDMAAAVARVTQARAASRAAGAQLLPTFDLSATAARQHQSVISPLGALLSQEPGYTRNFNDFSVGPSASWELDLFGGLRRGARAASAEAQAAEANEAGARVMVAADTADAYLQVRGYQARLAVANDQIRTDERLLRLVQDRYNAGAGTGRETAQAEAVLLQARASVPLLKVELEKQLNRLDVLMGVQPGTYAAELAVPADIPGVPAIPDAQPTEMLRRRPDVIAAERRLAASNERIGQAVSDYYPKLSLSGALGFDSLTKDHLFSSAARQSVLSGGLRWRLFDFGKVGAEVKLAKGANAEALAVYQASVLHAAEDVENALMLFSQTQQRNETLAAQVKAVSKARDLSEQAYRAGSIPLTDVLAADTQLLTARDQLDASRADASRSAVGVYRALGGGWSLEAGHRAPEGQPNTLAKAASPPKL